MKKQLPYEETTLYRIRHTAAHVLAMAAREYDPKVKFAIGPPIENGFYYDFEFSKPLTTEDLPILEKSMKKIIAKNIPVTCSLIDRKEALHKATAEKQVYKKELIEQLSDKELSHYSTDWFTDLCKGPHVSKTGDIPAVKLLSVAGAYWRGNEHQPMLTRIYGTAFESEAELSSYLEKIEEAKKRDHKILGPKLGLFVFSDLVGSGLPLWTPKGTVLRNLLDDYVWSLREKYGYQKVEIPHITKKDLYQKSGHWDKFQDELFRIKTREGHEFVMKPMNCPHHTQIFAAESRSYREMPIRYANTTMCYRDEQTGELSGLSRLRGFTQDDAHVFCRKSQIEQEMSTIWDIIEEFYRAFGFNLSVRLSLSDPTEPKKYLGERKNWEVAEDILRLLAKKRRVAVEEVVGEAAFYGPKIDFITEDSLGRSWQVATIQLDFNMPERFDLYCINEEGKQERIVMIHAAIMGSIERFMSVLIEHFAGAFPFWLSPTQIRILPISEKFTPYAQEVLHQLNMKGYRVELDSASETLGKRIRQSELEKIPYVMVVGEKEQQDATVTLRIRQTPEQTTMKIDEFIRSTPLRQNR